MRNALLALLVLPAGLAAQDSITRDVVYAQGDTTLEGYLALPPKAAPAHQVPVVLVVHQWMGLGEWEKSQARRLAELGYAAFAVDVYGQGVRAQNAQEAGRLSSRYKNDPELYRARLLAGLKTARAFPETDAKTVGAIGYCFGGTGVLELARAGADVAAVVSFHGGLGTEAPAAKGAIKARVLVCHGGADPLVSDEELVGFLDEMRQAEVADYEVIIYANAKHAFTDPKADDYGMAAVGYDEKAAKRSWAAMRRVFAAEGF